MYAPVKYFHIKLLDAFDFIHLILLNYNIYYISYIAFCKVIIKINFKLNFKNVI